MKDSDRYNLRHFELEKTLERDSRMVAVTNAIARLRKQVILLTTGAKGDQLTILRREQQLPFSDLAMYWRKYLK